MKTCAEGGRHREVSSAANRGAAERVLRASLSAEVLIGEAERCARPPACGLMV